MKCLVATLACGCLSPNQVSDAAVTWSHQAAAALDDTATTNRPKRQAHAAPSAAPESGPRNTDMRARQRRIYVDAAHGIDALDGGTASQPYQTIDRALGDVPDLVDAAYTIELAPGVYHEEVTLDRFSMPSGTMKSTWAISVSGTLPARYLLFHGNETAPESVVIAGQTFCFNASSVLLMLRGLTCRGATDAGVEMSGGGLVLDDVSFSDNGAGAAMIEHSLMNWGGRINALNSGALIFSFRNNSFVRDSTPWHADVNITIEGSSRSGLFLRDHSALAFQSGGSTISIKRSSPWAVYAQQHSHVFGGPFTIADVNVGFQVTDYSYINAEVPSAERVGAIVGAYQNSFVSMEHQPVVLTGVGTLMEIDPTSWGRVGAEFKYGSRFVQSPPP